MESILKSPFLRGGDGQSYEIEPAPIYICSSSNEEVLNALLALDESFQARLKVLLNPTQRNCFEGLWDSLKGDVRSIPDDLSGDALKLTLGKIVCDMQSVYFDLCNASGMKDDIFSPNM